MVHLHPAGDYSAVYLIPDIKSASSAQDAVRVCRHRQEAVLHIHGIPEDSLGQALVKDMENDTGAGDQREIAGGA